MISTYMPPGITLAFPKFDLRFEGAEEALMLFVKVKCLEVAT